MTRGGGRVLVTSAASSPAIDISRSLKLDPSLEVVGADASDSGRRMARRICDRMIELPPAAEDPSAYADALHEATRQMEFVFICLDAEVAALLDADRLPECPNAVPFECAEVILDKGRTAAALPDRLCPATAEVDDPAGLAEALTSIPPPVWLRPTTGASGQGSLRIDDPDQGFMWIDFWSRRGLDGRWMVQEYLPGRNVNWTGLFREGALMASSTMERQKYFLDKVSVSGVTGQVSQCETVAAPDFADAAMDAVSALSAAPSGLYSVDLCGDADGKPRVTEVNPRPAGRPWLYTEAGVNLPLAAYRALTGQDIGDAVAPGAPEIGVRLHRQLDVEPLFIRP